MKDWEKRRDKLAEIQALSFSGIQFPPTWVETGRGLEHDVNAGRRERCHNDHKLGFKEGFKDGRTDVLNELKPQLERARKLLEPAHTESALTVLDKILKEME